LSPPENDLLCVGCDVKPYSLTIGFCSIYVTGSFFGLLLIVQQVSQRLHFSRRTVTPPRTQCRLVYFT